MSSTLSSEGVPGQSPIGNTIDRYVILEPLGQGGMGVVYAAWDPQLHRRVAVKLLPEAADLNERARGRLLREAQAMAQLSHPNVVPVFDAGVANGRMFIAIELIEGETLASRLARGPTWREALSLLMRAGRGLAAAHAAGIVHRDFKPSNVLLGSDGRVMVSDFGLARVDSAAEDGLTPNIEHPRLTQTGAVMGTPRYMSPEQHLGRPSDARSDQFSFCVVLYEAVYGQSPFGDRDEAQTVEERLRLAERVTDPRAVEPPARAGAPAWLRRVIERGMSVDPTARYRTMDELLRDLDRRPSSRRWWGLGITLAVASVAGGAVFYATRDSVPDSPSRIEEKPVAVDKAPVTPATRATVAGECSSVSVCQPACEHGDQHGCVGLGKLMQEGKEIAKDARGAHQLFVSACDRGERRGCLEAGVDLLDGTGVLMAKAVGASLVVKSCELGSPTGCLVLGTLQLSGDGVAKDAAAAAASFHKSCEADTPGGCVYEGEAYLRGEGVAKNPGKATALFQRACTAKHGDGCMMLGHRYLRGDGAPKDPKRAADIFQAGCDYGSAKACYALARAYERGSGVAVDRTQAKQLFERACKGGFREACEMPARAVPSTPSSGGFCSGYGSWGLTCNGSCVNSYNDNDHCGACGNHCTDGNSCKNGYCLK